MKQCFSLDLMDVSLSLDSRVSILEWIITGRDWQSQQYRHLYILCTFLRHYMAVLESVCVCEWVNLLRLKWQDGHLLPEGFPRVVTLDLKTTMDIVAFNYWLIFLILEICWCVNWFYHQVLEILSQMVCWGRLLLTVSNESPLTICNQISSRKLFSEM